MRRLLVFIKSILVAGLFGVITFAGPRGISLPILNCGPALALPHPSGVSSVDNALKNQIKTLVGPKDAVILADPDVNIILALNEETPLIPASTLKVLTALTAMSILGENFKFVTQFYLDPHQNLIIKGFGDPILVSESIKKISRHLSTRLNQFNDLVLDDRYFEKPLTIPGVTDSLQPYDAPNGALCANFNSVNFRRNRNKKFVSAEPQTPLLPLVMNRIRSSGMNEGRILLSAEEDECTRYAGHLFLYYLKDSGIKTSNKIRMGKVDQNKDRLIYTHVSEMNLKTMIQKMLEFSNNYMANQMMIAASAKAFGEPGSLEKGVKAIRQFVSQNIPDFGINVVEGSGISRQNKVTAITMLKILQIFRPYHDLMRREGPVFYKTGTLSDVRARMGYIIDSKKRLHPFVILLNTPGKTDSGILNRMIGRVQSDVHPMP